MSDTERLTLRPSRGVAANPTMNKLILLPMLILCLLLNSGCLLTVWSYERYRKADLKALEGGSR